MESVSLILIAVGAAIIGVVLLLRLGLRLRHRAADEAQTAPRGDRESHGVDPDFDPLFAVDAVRAEPSDGDLAALGKIVAEQEEPRESPPSAQTEPLAGVTRDISGISANRRRPPRTAEDPHRVVVLNVIAGEDRAFAGPAVRDAVERSGFEYGEWQIFHYYSPAHGDAPPLFSLANMVKPGSFELENMDAMSTAGLSLFMVPAGAEDDVAAFDTMLAKSRQLAADLGGEVRDARRSVLTRQAIGHIREQLNEWSCKTQAAQH
jgi:cell division protein ZipA